MILFIYSFVRMWIYIFPVYTLAVRLSRKSLLSIAENGRISQGLIKNKNHKSDSNDAINQLNEEEVSSDEKLGPHPVQRDGALSTMDGAPSQEKSRFLSTRNEDDYHISNISSVPPISHNRDHVHKIRRPTLRNFLGERRKRKKPLQYNNFGSHDNFLPPPNPQVMKLIQIPQSREYDTKNQLNHISKDELIPDYNPNNSLVLQDNSDTEYSTEDESIPDYNPNNSLVLQDNSDTESHHSTEDELIPDYNPNNSLVLQDNSDAESHHSIEDGSIPDYLSNDSILPDGSNTIQECCDTDYVSNIDDSRFHTKDDNHTVDSNSFQKMNSDDDNGNTHRHLLQHMNSENHYEYTSSDPLQHRNLHDKNTDMISHHDSTLIQIVLKEKDLDTDSLKNENKFYPNTISPHFRSNKSLPIISRKESHDKNNSNGINTGSQPSLSSSLDETLSQHDQYAPPVESVFSGSGEISNTNHHIPKKDPRPNSVSVQLSKSIKGESKNFKQRLKWKINHRLTSRHPKKVKKVSVVLCDKWLSHETIGLCRWWLWMNLNALNADQMEIVWHDTAILILSIVVALLLCLSYRSRVFTNGKKADFSVPANINRTTLPDGEFLDGLLDFTEEWHTAVPSIFYILICDCCFSYMVLRAFDTYTTVGLLKKKYAWLAFLLPLFNCQICFLCFLLPWMRPRVRGALGGREYNNFFDVITSIFCGPLAVIQEARATDRAIGRLTKYNQKVIAYPFHEEDKFIHSSIVGPPIFSRSDSIHRLSSRTKIKSQSALLPRARKKSSVGPALYMKIKDHKLQISRSQSPSKSDGPQEIDHRKTSVDYVLPNLEYDSDTPSQSKITRFKFSKKNERSLLETKLDRDPRETVQFDKFSDPEK